MTKSIFVILYMVVAVTITSNAAQLLWATKDLLSWGGVLLVTTPFVVVLGRMMIFKDVARTSARLPALLALGAAGVVLATLGYLRGGSAAAPVMAIVGWLGFIVYDFWYSSFGRQSSRQLQVGSTLPGFELRDPEGQAVSSDSLTDKPAVWMFYRGNWCPLCMAQIKEVAAQYREIESLGARVVLVSPQPQRHTRALAKRFDVAMEFLTDEGNKVARALGIDQSHGVPMGMQLFGYASETVLPTVVITAAGGRILWAHETDNYRVRPEPEEFLAVLSMAMNRG